MAKVKLIDVAQLAGVSKSTVSQYLNGRFEYMSKVTQDKVRAAVKALDYVPNPIARNLKATNTKTIGVIVRDITGFYTSKAIRGIDDYCKANDYNALIYNTDFDSEIEAKSLNALYHLRVDGIIIASSGKNPDLLNAYVEKGLPIVQFQLEHDGSEKNIILSDYQQAAYQATEYLIELGHRRICFVTQDFENVKSRHERYLGYAAALSAHNIPLDTKLIEYWSRETGFKNNISQTLAHNQATALFAQHLAITTDLLAHLNEANIAIPQQVSLLGFDDIPMAEFFAVPITVVKQQPYLIGHKAAELLLSHIHTQSSPAQRIMVPCTLEQRRSCRLID